MVQKDEKHFKGRKLVDQAKSWSTKDFFQWSRSAKLHINSSKFMSFSSKTVIKDQNNNGCYSGNNLN